MTMKLTIKLSFSLNFFVKLSLCNNSFATCGLVVSPKFLTMKFYEGIIKNDNEIDNQMVIFLKFPCKIVPL